MNNLTQQYLSYTSDCNSCKDMPCNSMESASGLAQSGENAPSPPPNMKSNVCTNSGFNYGISSRLDFDPDFIRDDIEQSTAPIMSVLDPNRVKNCNQCLSLNGPRASHNGWGDSIPIANPSVTPAQDLIDIDSIMSNRNVRQDRSKKGHVNMVDVFKFKTYDSKICDRGLDPLNSTLTYPKQLYREMSINRFYDLNNNPQTNIYYDWAINSQLEAKDNYDYPYPFFIGQDNSLPKAVRGPNSQANPEYPTNCSPKVYEGREWGPMMKKDMGQQQRPSNSKSVVAESSSSGSDSDSDSYY